MITISLCMIVKNEEPVIARILEQMKDIADEMIIVDTGSVDQTKEIAKKYTDQVFEYPLSLIHIFYCCGANAPATKKAAHFRRREPRANLARGQAKASGSSRSS